MRLAALFSGGKDSCYAMYKAMKEHEIVCLVSLISENKDSYMFHTPNIHLVEEQTEAIGIPLILKKTKGVKEKELDDIKQALIETKEKYNIEGVVTGALFSDYQRERIENIGKELSLEIISPLWHMPQEDELREIVKDGFEFIITKVSAEGLDKTWLNKVITNKEIDELIKINKKIGMNIAFEGGEAETLMINGPIFKKKLIIEDFEIKEESDIIAEMIIKKVNLV